MNTYIIESYSFPCSISDNKIFKVNSNKSLEDVLYTIQLTLKLKNPKVKNKIYGCTQEEFLNNIKELKIS